MIQQQPIVLRPRASWLERGVFYTLFGLRSLSDLRSIASTSLLLTLPIIMFKVVSVLDSRMPIKKIQVGQVWKKEDSGDSYLVTKIYNEALATFAVLRKAGSETDAPLRIRVGHAGASPTLPGFRFAQESEEF